MLSPGLLHPAKTITDADYADDIAILANTHNQAETLLHSLEQAAAGIALDINAHKTEYMCYNQTGDISTLDRTPLKLEDKFTYLGSSVKSTEKDIDTRLTKAWTAINRLSIKWKSDLTDKMKCSFFQAAVASILLYGCTTSTLTKRLERKLDGNYTRMLRAILNKSWRQHPTRHQLYGHLPHITKTIKVRRTRHAGHCWRSRDELISDVLLWTPTHGRTKAGRPARTYSQQLCEDTEVVQKTCLRRWTIGKSGERGSGISVLPARHDDDDKSTAYIYLSIYSHPCIIVFSHLAYSILFLSIYLSILACLSIYPCNLSLYICVGYIYIYICVCVCVCVCIKRERERDREREVHFS